MRTVDITVDDLVHQVRITYVGTRTRVQPCCDHGVPEEVLMALCGIEPLCGWLATILQFQLRLGIPLEEATPSSRLPVSPPHPHPMALWKAQNAKPPWSLQDLEGWRKDGRTPEQAADVCARYRHRVNLRVVAIMITVEVPVTCGGEDHQVVLNIDGLGRIRCIQPDHDQPAESVLEALGGAPTDCGAAKLAITRLRSAVPKALERARWVRVGVRNLGDLDAWRNAGVRKPGIAEHWLTFTDRDRVAEWRGRGFPSPGKAAPWARAGFDPGCAQLWVKAGKTTEEALAWTAYGVSSATCATGWGRLGVGSPEEIEPWVRAGVASGSEAKVWALLDVHSPTDVRRWLRAGALDAEDTLAWIGFGVNLDQAPSQIREWRRAGAVSGEDAAAWWRAGAESSELSHWRADGLESGRELLLWRALGVESREDLRRWRAAGVEDTEDAKAWVKAGVRSPADLVSWRAAGVRDGRDALSWVLPPFVGSLREVAAWKEAGVTDPDEARRRLAGIRMPESVLRARIAGFSRLINPNGGRPGEVGPARIGASPTAVTTDRYFYAFSRPCQPDVATDVIEVDFDADGNEVSRDSRPVININQEGSHVLQRFLLNPSPEVLLRVAQEYQEKSIDAPLPREE